MRGLMMGKKKVRWLGGLVVCGMWRSTRKKSGENPERQTETDRRELPLKNVSYQVGLGDAAHVDEALHRLDHLHHAPERRALVLSWS